jgi:hypothetical protein
MTAAKSRRSAYVTLTTHVPREVAHAIRTAANDRGISVSAAAANLLAEALRISLEHSHAALLEAVVRQAITHEIRRLDDLTFRAALDSDETRRLVLTLLVKEIGPEQTRMFRREAHSASWQRLKEPLAVPPEHHGTWPATPARS